jgi:hypothetical protein
MTSAEEMCPAGQAKISCQIVGGAVFGEREGGEVDVRRGRDREVGDAAGTSKASAGIAEAESTVNRERGVRVRDIEGVESAGATCCDMGSRRRHVGVTIVEAIW